MNELWNSNEGKSWQTVLDLYWQMPTVRMNLEIERFMDGADFDHVKGLAPREWYEFLEKYFRWKFTGNYLDDRLANLAQNSLDQLALVKRDLAVVARDDFELADAGKCLNLVKSPRIRGLGYPGASGLLAILFKKVYGTVDRMIVDSLCDVETLPERERMEKIRARLKDKKDWELRDAVIIIEIMRRKAAQLNDCFDTDCWTPRKIDMVLWTFRNGGTCEG